MKLSYFFILQILLSFPTVASGSATSLDSLKYVNAAGLPLIGKGVNDSQDRYDRLPATLEAKCRKDLWTLSKNSSGLAIRFRTNSRTIAAKWEVTGNIVFNHMAPTGMKGLDLYCLKNGKWQYVNTARPGGKISNVMIIDHMSGEEMEYMMYLPLYDGLANLEIGVEHTSTVDGPLVDSPRKEKPVVFYGTSITQGGCASRTGMSYTNQLTRMLDRLVINLGFSGNGKLDLEIAEVMANMDASCFVMDCLPNVNASQMNEKYVRFLEIIREKKPDVPILLVENIFYPHMYFNQNVYKDVQERNATLMKIYSGQKGKGDRNIYYLKGDNLIGNDFEGTVDGVHLTDLGFWRMSQNMYPVIKRLINR
ncbi:MAG: SGNH/GDSL hydrolase family protein [Prolixibacteraceae bacterium]|jgi:lysophospholipase L1-like esterase|nr:SGNH/GDSL hydrolase family protein [Prolixibacteraceae bacterium]